MDTFDGCGCRNIYQDTSEVKKEDNKDILVAHSLS